MICLVVLGRTRHLQSRSPLRELPRRTTGRRARPSSIGAASCKQVPKSEHRAKTASRRPEMGGSGAVLVLRDAVVHAALHYYWQRLISARSAGFHIAARRPDGPDGSAANPCVKPSCVQ